MNVEARMKTMWAVKWIGLGLFMVYWGGLCINDGLYAYPRDDEMFRAFEELDSQGLKDQWPELAAEKGYDEEPPKELHAEMDILTQWIQLAICWPLGFGALGMVAVTSRRKLLATDEGFIGANGKLIPYGDITDIDYTRWNSKWIAMVIYQDENDEPQEAKIDGWVFEGGEDVLLVVEEQTGISQDPMGE
jgi:hypothetical protein